ncbi:hypothetical protein NG54_17760 [Heyndrickxia ginsengihumi]|uniref:Uncharacterized protein n=1 Tax=Heyndrickxia ginsengihumi TaxID=363870 RepID=A0A0A6VC23_9BACI|nr:hypothetical protein [Heyndrickxia ginsengihumi]KHD84099.1 hypothetical protein NG54_17760 [Heyndrickxia ginsengihumi]
MITIERVSKVLNHFNIAFTENAVIGLLATWILEKSPRIENGYYSRNTKYGYSVNVDSLMNFLLNRGFTEKEIKEIISA